MTKPIILVKICYKLLKIVLVSNFLASADIRVFGRTCLFAMLLLNGLTLFYTTGFSISLLFVTNITVTLWKHISICYFEA